MQNLFSTVFFGPFFLPLGRTGPESAAPLRKIEIRKSWITCGLSSVDLPLGPPPYSHCKKLVLLLLSQHREALLYMRLGCGEPTLRTALSSQPVN